jgi:hypothetical protein
MPPKRKSPPTEDQLGSNPKLQKTGLLNTLVSEFGDLKSIQFEPFRPEERCLAQALLPSNFPTQPIPFDYFNLFFTSDLFDLITHNTNKYAAIQRLDKVEKGREWYELNTAELRVFIGVIIYMGVYIAPDTTWYWNTDTVKGLIHSIPSHLLLRRFEQIKRYLYISCVETDKLKGFDQPNNKVWWYKLKPFAS